MSTDDSARLDGDDLAAWFAEDQQWPANLSGGNDSLRNRSRRGSALGREEPYYGSSLWVEEPLQAYGVNWVFPSGWRPKVVIHPIVQARTRMWTEAAAPYEVGWSLACALDKFGNIHLFEADLPGQDVWSAEYKIRKGDFDEQAQRWIAENGGECLPFMRGVGHSHVRMPVFASAQDEDEQEGNLNAYKHLPWAVQQILNLRGEMLVRIHLFGAGLQERREWGYPVIENPEIVLLDPMALPGDYLAQYTSELAQLREKCAEEVAQRLRRWEGRQKVEHGQIAPQQLEALRAKLADKGGYVEVERPAKGGKLEVTVRYPVTSRDKSEVAEPTGILARGIDLPVEVFGDRPSEGEQDQTVLDAPFTKGGEE